MDERDDVEEVVFVELLQAVGEFLHVDLKFALALFHTHVHMHTHSVRMYM